MYLTCNIKPKTSKYCSRSVATVLYSATCQTPAAFDFSLVSTVFQKKGPIIKSKFCCHIWSSDYSLYNTKWKI